MICRIWRGWTSPSNADAYAGFLKTELFPSVEKELGGHGYRGFQVLRTDKGAEVEFVTMVWFDSLEAVQAFAGPTYETPVIHDRARALLSRFADRCDHYEVGAFRWSSQPGPL